MSKITDIPKRLKAAFEKQGDLLLLIELAAIMLVVTAAANYIFNYAGKVVSYDESVKSWEYIYTNSSSVPYGAEWNTANSINPMSTEKLGNYLHLRGNFDENDSERTLVVKTDFSPIIISVNGETVYNNHYGKSEYVGNSYNAVVLPASGDKTTVEISIRLPFTAEIETYIAGGGASTAFPVSGGTVFSAVLILLGVAALIVAIVFLISKRKFTPFFAASGLIVLYGAAAGVSALAHDSYIFNFPEFYNISLALEFFIIILFAVSVATLLKIKDKKFVFLLCLSIASIAFVIMAPSASVLKTASLTATAVTFLCIASLIKPCMRMISTRIQYSKSAFLMLDFLAMFDLLSGIMQATVRFRTSFAYCRLIGGFVFICYIVSVFAAKSVSTGNQKTIRLKTDAYSSCVTKVADLFTLLLSLDSEEEICRVAAENVCSLYCEINAETESPAYAVFVNESSEHKEICRHSLEGPVNCALIENRCADSQSHCIFTESYADLAFIKDDRFHIIFHFENMKNALSPFFTAIITTLYSGVDVAIERLSGTDAEQVEINIFTRLACKTETASGNNPDHLEKVAAYTDLIMDTMGYPQDVRDAVSKAAMLHDIGKIALPTEITNKTGLLSGSEREAMKMHTEYGRLLLSAFDSDRMKLAAAIANEHHERYDGKGYNGIAGKNINEYARIVTVADVLDALTAKRSYKDPWPFDEVIGHIDSNSGTLYDPDVVEAVHNCIDKIKQIATENE